MSRFYGNIWGNRGEATRMGSTDSGFSASCRSWRGSVTVCMWAHDEGKRGRADYHECDMVSIQVADGSRTGGRTVWRGTVADLVRKVEAGHELRLVKPRRT